MAIDCLPQYYLILETSAELRRRQKELLQARLPGLLPRVAWLDALPASIDALVIANEVLDAMPVHLVETGEAGIAELGVDDTLQWEKRAATGPVHAAALALALPTRYTTEIALAVRAFVRTLAAHLKRGVVLLIDYGFPARELYHAQRDRGTLMCHYRQHAHGDP